MVSPAHGNAFSSNFAVGNCPTVDRFKLALVDISDKGCTAGSWSLVTRRRVCGSARRDGVAAALAGRQRLPRVTGLFLRLSHRYADSIALAIGDYNIGSGTLPPLHFYADSRRFTVFQRSCWTSSTGSNRSISCAPT